MKKIYTGFSLLLVAILSAGCATTYKGNSQDVSNILTNHSDNDASAVQGNWKLKKAELGGQPMADAILNIISLKLDNGKYEVFVGKEPDRGIYTLDSDTKSMTITGTEGPNTGKTFPAIYDLKDDTLRICYDLSGAKRPSEFKSTGGTKLFFVTYNRKKE